MKRDQTTQSNQSINAQRKALFDELEVLLDRAKNVVQEIDETNKQAVAVLDNIDAKVGELITTVEKIYSDLDQIEKETGDEMDKLILQQAEALSEE